MMPKTHFLLLLTTLAPGLAAQKTFDQEEMKTRYEAMLASGWYTGAGWTTDFAAAKARAKKLSKPIFAYFTRSYAP